MKRKQSCISVLHLASCCLWALSQVPCQNRLSTENKMTETKTKLRAEVEKTRKDSKKGSANGNQLFYRNPKMLSLEWYKTGKRGKVSHLSSWNRFTIFAWSIFKSNQTKVSGLLFFIFIVLGLHSCFRNTMHRIMIFLHLHSTELYLRLYSKLWRLSTATIWRKLILATFIHDLILLVPT